MKTENEERKLTIANANIVNSDIFGSGSCKRATSLDLNDEKQAEVYLNSMQDADFKLNDCVGKKIKVIGANITESLQDTINEETGEVITRKKHSLCIFDENYKSYVTGSGACYQSFAMIVALKGMPTPENPITVEVIKTDAKEKGHQYLKLKIAK